METLDKEGRCLITELFPEQCACKWHRDLEEQEEDDDIQFDPDRWNANQ